jgi:hypothetical protein
MTVQTSGWSIVTVKENDTAFGTGRKWFLQGGVINAVPKSCMVFAIPSFQPTQPAFRRLVTHGM